MARIDVFFFFQAEDGIRDLTVTGVQTCALPISYIKYGLDPQEGALKAGRVPDEPDWDAEPSELYGELTGPEGTRTIPTIPSSFTHYYENVRDAILGEAQLVVTPEQARNVIRGLELAVASSQQRCVLPWSAST